MKPKVGALIQRPNLDPPGILLRAGDAADRKQGRHSPTAVSAAVERSRSSV